jgi:RNA polymerase sigma factor for flagellar operon FliA
MEPPLTIAQHGLVRKALYVVGEEAAKLKRKYGALVELDDLMSLGKIALYGCARRFVAAPGRTFAGYARFRVRGAMRDDIRGATREARVRREMAREGSHRMADYHDDFDVLRHERSEFERRLDLMTEHHATAMWLGGAMQVRREAEQDPEAAAEYARTLAVLDDVLGPLDADERQLLDLIYASEFEVGEVAEALGVVRETAGRRIKRLLEQLRRALVARGITYAPQPMNHAGVRPSLVPRGPPPERRRDGDAGEDEEGDEREPGDDPAQ